MQFNDSYALITGGLSEAQKKYMLVSVRVVASSHRFLIGFSLKINASLDNDT